VRDAGVVDEDVEAAELSTSGAEESIDRVRVANIAGVREDLNLRGDEFPADSGQRGPVAGGQDQIATFGSESTGDAETYAASGAGDEGDTAVEADGV
jgi:hypothetical protein